MPEYHAGDPFGLVGPRGELILDAASAKVLNDARAELKRLGRLRGIPPVVVSEDGAGRRIALDLTPTFHAKLGGSGNPYSYVEQVAVAGGTWADRAGGRTGSDAYEANGVSGLSGKVVPLRLSDAGDWRFQYVRKGAATFTGSLRGCNNISTGLGVQAVTVKDGATTIWTGSSDANGNYTGTGTLPSSVTVEVASNGRFAAFSGSRTVTGTTNKVIAAVTLSPASGYHCLLACAVPLAGTLSLTAGTPTTGCPRTWEDDTLTFTASSPAGTQGWIGTVYQDGSPFITTGRYFMDTTGGLALMADDGSKIGISTYTTTNGHVTCPPAFLVDQDCAGNSAFVKFVGTVTE